MISDKGVKTSNVFWMRAAVSLLLALSLASCGLFGNRYALDSGDGAVHTLGQRMDTAQLKNTSNEDNNVVNAAELTGSAVADVYRSAYELIEDPVAKNHILQRLAALDLKTAENLEIAGLSESQEAYQVAIDAYTSLLASSDDNRDELLYALSKAYALIGDSASAQRQLDKLVAEFPESRYWSESQFRRGETLFVENDFNASAEAFESILQKGSTALYQDSSSTNNDFSQDDFISNAQYMAAWSRFKSSDYEKALGGFVKLLDRKLGREYKNVHDVNSLLVRDYLLGEKAFYQEDKIVEDALRAIGLSLAYGTTESSMASLEDALGDKSYAHLAYVELAELYFKQERFADAAKIYSAYEQLNDNSALSPWFLTQTISVLQYAGFAERAWQQKAAFSDRYHTQAAYYQAHLRDETSKNENGSVASTSIVNDAIVSRSLVSSSVVNNSLVNSSLVNNYIDKRLPLYLDELAAYYHARARALDAASRESKTDMLTQAAYWYRQKISAYPNDAEIASTYYLLAESLRESQKLPESIEAFEFAAYSGHPFVDASEAGYAAILVYDDYIDSLTREAPRVNGEAFNSADQSLAELESRVTGWREKKVESALLFTDYFPEDARRASVLANTVNDLKQLENWPRLLVVADMLLFDQVAEGEVAESEVNESRLRAADIAPSLAIPTWLSSAGAAYSLNQYADAEQRYAQAIDAMAVSEAHDSEQRAYVALTRENELQSTIDNYASSIYRQAELANEAGDSRAAIQQFQRLVRLAPTSKLRVSAQRDAIVLMVATEQWGAVVDAVPQFIRDFPSHEEGRDMQRRLLSANVALQEWEPASSLATSLARELEQDGLESSRAEAQELRFAAADYALSSGDKRLAITRYLTILDNYPEIDEVVYETHFRLAGLYRETSNQRQELERYRIIQQLEPYDASRSDRSLYIVALAESKLAELDLQRYRKLKIKEPLLESLNKKRVALEAVVASYVRTENYAVEEFALLATERKAQVYADFAKAIMASDRPQGLDDLALEEYEILLEEQAYPFEEQAIELYEVNIRRAWEGKKSPAIRDSYNALSELMPARYNKPEILE